MTSNGLVERMLSEGEKDFRVLAGAAPLIMWMASADRLCTDFNATWLIRPLLQRV
jgi:hypothetical protein